MTAATSKRIVLVSLLGLMGMAAYKGNLSGDQGILKRLWGVSVLGLILTAAADFAPQVAGPFALLVLLGYATSGGDKAIENVLGKISGSSGSVPVSGGAASTILSSGAGQVVNPVSPGTNP